MTQLSAHAAAAAAAQCELRVADLLDEAAAIIDGVSSVDGGDGQQGVVRRCEEFRTSVHMDK